MSILTKGIYMEVEFKRFIKQEQKRSRVIHFVLLMFVVISGCKGPEEKIVLRKIRDVVVDASTEPVLRANAVFFNPNDMRGKLKRINVEVYVDGKKAAFVNQKLKTQI